VEGFLNKLGGRRGVAGRFEAWLERVVSDKEKVARFMLVAYWVSTAVTLLGAILIVWYFAGGRR
jgi:hypothetical protein